MTLQRDVTAEAPAVDLVYAWVDGDDPQFQADIRRYASGSKHLNPERTRDPYDLLRYSLRSAAMFVPWIRNVHIITCRPQVPRWLDLSHPRVRVIHHDQLAGFGPYLPTFNATTIESFAHAVPGLSDHFLYLNDDFLFGAPTEREDFLARNGKHRVTGTHFGLWFPFRIYRKRWEFFNTGSIEHCPRLCYKPFWEAMLRANQKVVHRTRSSRFRRGSDLRFDRLYRMWMLGPMRRHAEVVRSRELLRYHRFHKIDNNRKRQGRRLDALMKMRPKFYCLNDDQGDHPDTWVRDRVRDFLAEYYPDASEFERQEES
jgi:hypothetical protein